MDASRSVEDLSTSLFSAITLMIRRMRQLPAPGELTLPERSALGRLDRGGPATAAELARIEQISPQAMGMTLGSLADKGLVARERDAGDRRRSVASLTAAGREMVRRKRHARARLIADAMVAEGFTHEELQTLAAAAPLIQRLAERI